METGANVFDYIFNPRAVAIIGASPFDLATQAHMKTKMREHLYLVNPKYTELLGKKCYPGILEDEKDRHYNLLLKRTFTARGFPVYATLDAMVKAAANLCRYSERRNRVQRASPIS
ncbi:MAG: hypothetical protein Q8O28_10495 [Smithellaceae bacterium]|nr:hypothetical protein [Smithellaceae bacterium]